MDKKAGVGAGRGLQPVCLIPRGCVWKESTDPYKPVSNLDCVLQCPHI